MSNVCLSRVFCVLSSVCLSRICDGTIEKPKHKISLYLSYNFDKRIGCKMSLNQEKWYKKVVEACALEHDFKQWEFGDLTLVGEKGVALSGGQKARVTLARCVYRSVQSYDLSSAKFL